MHLQRDNVNWGVLRMGRVLKRASSDVLNSCSIGMHLQILSSNNVCDGVLRTKLVSVIIVQGSDLDIRSKSRIKNITLPHYH